MTQYLISVKGLPMKEWKRGKEATRRQNKRYYQLHREEELKRSRRYLEENREIINLKRRARYARAKLAQAGIRRKTQPLKGHKGPLDC